MLEERRSLVTGSMEVFLKNKYLGDEIIYRGRMVDPIRDRRTALDSACSIAYHRLE